MKTVVLVEASTTSPSPTLTPRSADSGAPLLEGVLEHVLERVFVAREPFEIVVATTTDPIDDPLFLAARKLGVECFRGAPHDPLDRHWRAADSARARAVVLVRAGAPLLDPHAVDRVLQAHYSSGVDYTSNLEPDAQPDGRDVEVVDKHALTLAWQEATCPVERAQTTPFVWRRAHRFRLKRVPRGAS